MLGVDAAVEDDEGIERPRIERTDARRIAKRYALAHLLADALRVLYNLPVLQAEHARATINAIAATAGIKTF